MLVVVRDPRLGAGLALVGDVDRRGGVVSDQDRRQPGPLAGQLAELRDLGRNLLPHPRSHGAAVDDLRTHAVHARGSLGAAAAEALLSLGSIAPQIQQKPSPPRKPPGAPLALRNRRQIGYELT